MVIAVLWIAVIYLPSIVALDNGVALTPPMAWSTWNTFRFNVSEDLILQFADLMSSLGLQQAGYEYILIDDGWPLCLQQDSNGFCLQIPPRDNKGQIQVDQKKFPNGFKYLTSQVHKRGIKIGIYTAVSTTTCGGYPGSLHNEKIDAASFAEWGFDFVKYDTCNYDCSVHDGCIQNSTAAMRDGLNATGKQIVFYIDAGNPSSPQRLYNPLQHNVDPKTMTKVANKWSELVWVWGPDTANIWKSWYDVDDNWMSVLDSVHHQIGLEMYQKRGAFNIPDILPMTGQGSMTEGQYRASFFLWTVLGAPLILANDLRTMDNATLSLFTSPEIIAINQDSDCVQGSLLRTEDQSEIWGKPLNDSSFAVVLLNKDTVDRLITVYIVSTGYCDGGSCNGGDFYPATFPGDQALVRDVYYRQNVGAFNGIFRTVVPALDAKIFKFSPVGGL